VLTLTGSDSGTVTNVSLVESSGGEVNARVEPQGGGEFLARFEKIPSGSFVVRVNGMTDSETKTFPDYFQRQSSTRLTASALSVTVSTQPNMSVLRVSASNWIHTRDDLTDIHERILLFLYAQ